MRIAADRVLNKRQNISFGRALTSKELVEYRATINEAKKKIKNDGKSILIVHDACLPQSADKNTGVGNLSSKQSLEFFEFMRDYLNINAVEVLPAGEMKPIKDGKFYCSYASSAFSLSPHHINLDLLVTPEYGRLITQDDIKKVVQANNIEQKDLVVNYENIVNKGSVFDQTLNKAFLNFKSSRKVNSLKEEFEQYKKKNADWLEPKVVFNALSNEYGHDDWHKWNDLDRNLMSDDSDIAKERIKALNSKNTQDAEFYKFKQFMADRHLSQARKNLNEKGIKLIGDCLVGFSKDEIWANQKALDLSTTIGWGVPSFDYTNIENPNSESAKLLKKKVQLFANRYDSIRFDVSWSYVQPMLHSNKGRAKGIDFGDKLLKQIESHVKEVKGPKFDVSDLIHEFDAAPEDFEMVRNYGRGYEFRKEIQNRTKALGTTYMSNSWGNNQHYLSLNQHLPNFVLGAGNHDPQPLRQIAENIPDFDGRYHKVGNIEYLSRLFGTPKEKLENPVEFMKAKFAEVVSAKHNQYFYIDVFGESRRFDSQYHNTGDNYRQKIPSNYKQHYFKSLEEGFAFNPMDALARVFKLRGWNELEPELYKKLIKFSKILAEKADVAVQIGAQISQTQRTQKSPVAVALIGVTAALTGGYAFVNATSKNRLGQKNTLPKSK